MRNIDDHGHYHGHNVHNKGLRIPLVAHPRHYPRHGDEDDCCLMNGSAYPRHDAILQGVDNNENSVKDGHPLLHALLLGECNGKQRVKFSTSTRSST